MQKTLLFGALGAALCSAAAFAQVVINEFSPNPSGQDPATQTVELRGTPAESFTGTLLTIDSDFFTSGLPPEGFRGTVDRLTAVSGTFDANGLLTVEVDDLENPSFTIILAADDATAAIGDDLDVDGDGNLDTLDTLGTVHDAINIPDSADDALVMYADQLGGTSVAFVGAEPQLAFRETTTGVIFVYVGFEDTLYDQTGEVADQARFDLPPGVETFGAVNPSLTGAPDSDGDGVADNVDNCINDNNPLQIDSNGDEIGNVCDADIAGLSGAGDDDCTVNFADLAQIKTVFFSTNADADLTGDTPGSEPDGQVNFFDLGRMKDLFFAPPGPSAAGCDAGT